MSNIIIVNGDYSDELAIDTLVNYCANPQKAINYYACGVCGDTTQTVINGMKFMRNFLEKPGGKQLCHFIITIDTAYYDREQSEQVCIRVTRDVCDYLYQLGYQCFAAVHNNTRCVHVHVIVNTINIKTGKLMTNASALMYEYHSKLQNTYPQLNMRGVMFNRTMNGALEEI